MEGSLLLFVLTLWSQVRAKKHCNNEWQVVYSIKKGIQWNGILTTLFHIFYVSISSYFGYQTSSKCVCDNLWPFWTPGGNIYVPYVSFLILLFMKNIFLQSLSTRGNMTSTQVGVDVCVCYWQPWICLITERITNSRLLDSGCTFTLEEKKTLSLVCLAGQPANLSDLRQRANQSLKLFSHMALISCVWWNVCVPVCEAGSAADVGSFPDWLTADVFR